MNTIRRGTPFLLAIILFFAACQSPVNNTKTASDTSWLEEMTISRLQKGYADGEFKISDVVKAYIQRIEELDKNGPRLNSVIIINPDALQIAEELDKELASGKSRGMLHGVPVILKDNIDTHDKMPTTAGSLALKDSYPAEDSYVAKKLREAGAVILGKSNLSEWANFRATNSSSGWSGVGGQTKNPYVLDRNPCGSSSGSGVATSANLCMLAIGTETDGSIVCPSTTNGIVGIKPTVGLISRKGVIPISFSQDTPGPMCRTVEDAAITLGFLTGIDQSDSKTLESEGKYETDYTKYLVKNGLSGKRIGLVKKAMGFNEKVDKLMMEAVSYLKANGAEIVEVSLPHSPSGEELEVLMYEFKDGINKYLASTGDMITARSLEDLIEFNKKDPVELRYFNQAIFEESQKKGTLNEKEYKAALEKSLKAMRTDGIDHVMDSAKLDALISPTGSPAWKTDHLLGDHFAGGDSSPAAISGYPAITVPMGFVEDLPVGITFFGKAWSEGKLLTIAYSYEQGTKHRKAPGYLVTD
ncbi:MAG TPA: amidase [Bacteroidales bacterium]|nr:amidase [Bacteroidales bacterium]